MRTKCPKCNVPVQIDEKAYLGIVNLDYVCPVCGSRFTIQLNDQIGVQTKQPVQSDAINPNNQQSPYQATSEQQYAKANTSQVQSPLLEEAPTKRSFLIWIVPLIVLLICAGIGGWFYYQKVYLPEKIDREAPRYYTIANATNIRTSKSSGGDFNKIGSVPFGSELITYSYDTDWSEVKDANGNRGFVASDLIVEKSDFYRLNSIFGDASSREIIETVKCRRALLNYFKEHNYIGKIAQSDLQNIVPQVQPNSQNQWQVFTRAKGVKPNSVYFSRVINSASKFTDFAVVITNISTQDKRLLLFTFADDESSSLVYEEETSASYIENIYNYGNGNYGVAYYYAY